MSRTFHPARTAFSAAVMLALIVYVVARKPPAQDNPSITGSTFGPIPFRVLTADIALRPDERLQLAAVLKQELDAVNRAMSTWRDDSEISRFNRHAETNWFEVSEGFATVTAAALRFARETDGAFDPTLDSVINRLGFGDEPEDTNTVRGIDLLELDGNRLRKRHPGLRLNLSAIAKGYAVDRCSDLLLERGIPNHLVEIGGEVRARGVGPDGLPWPVFVTVPRPGELEIYATLTQLRDPAVATSGIAYQSREEDGRIVSHLVDPATGDSVQNDLRSVTVLAPTCMEADALATAIYVMGRKPGLVFAVLRPDTEVLMLYVEDGELREERSIGMR